MNDALRAKLQYAQYVARGNHGGFLTENRLPGLLCRLYRSLAVCEVGRLLTASRRKSTFSTPRKYNNVNSKCTGELRNLFPFSFTPPIFAFYLAQTANWMNNDQLPTFV